MLRIKRFGVASLAFALPFASASATVSPQGSVSERRVRPSVSDVGSSSGEMEYVFDTTLNKTSARFKTSLAGGNVFLRALSGPPTVHTLIADFEFAGRTPPHPPDAIRFSLMSDEFREALPGHRSSLGIAPILVIRLGDTLARYTLGIAQMTEELSASNNVSQFGHSPGGAKPVIDSHVLPSQLHIERTAIAWIPICDFLVLVRGKNIHGTVAGLEFELNESVVSGLRRFAAEMASTSDTSSASVNCK